MKTCIEVGEVFFEMALIAIPRVFEKKFKEVNHLLSTHEL
jgi:hypothetical protein